jgi:hypothetical protein
VWLQTPDDGLRTDRNMWWQRRRKHLTMAETRKERSEALHGTLLASGAVQWRTHGLREWWDVS